MNEHELHIVTGALGYSGKRIARRLLDAGCAVRTLTNSPNRPNPFGDSLEIEPFHFDDSGKMKESFRGASVFYNTYWVRFNHRDFTHQKAVDNTMRMFDAAAAAGVRRIVHVSISNPSADSPLEYFQCKARLERALGDSGIPHTILRPTVLFGGGEDILINNIAWSLRWFPVFPIFGDGKYKIQPIHVDDLADLAVHAGLNDESTDSSVIEAIGPETFEFRDLVKTISKIIGKKRLLIGAPPRLVYIGNTILGILMRDKMLTWPEVQGLMQGKLQTDAPPTGKIKLTDWARENADTLGRHYASELARRRDRAAAYVDT